jgi:hypothetical protein
MLEIMLQAIAVRRFNVADVTPKQYMFAAKDERDEFLLMLIAWQTWGTDERCPRCQRLSKTVTNSLTHP